jgi:putative hydrolase of HD superfamily
MNSVDIGFDPRLEERLNFLVEADKIKQVSRQSRLFDNSRFENDAEHSWTIALMAYLLREYANFEVNIEKVMLMLLIHDIVEADTGDTFLYAAERKDAHEKEVKAAARLFGLLGQEEGGFLNKLWNEFEDGKSPEAQFAKVFDRLEPLLQNYLTEGYTWKKHQVSYEMVIEKMHPIREASGRIWDFILALLEKAVEKGYLERA